MLFIQHSNFAQECTHTISGYITDGETNESLAGATLILKETSKTIVCNEQGYFEFKNICKGNYHLIISHIGCEDKEEPIYVDANKELSIEMPHLVNMLNGVELEDERKLETTQAVQIIKEQKIQKNANKNLANLLENLTGVTTIKTGSSIAKPVVHGMYGSRVLLLNNNIVQSGQQWGTDHAPEIDPLMAGSIEVIKGVAALEYQGSGLGAVINVLPRKIKDDEHIHGSFVYLGESNGLGNNTNFSLQQKKNSLGWEITGSLKKYGDSHTSNYYLNNTGYTEANIALQLEKNFSETWESKLYLSSFNTTLGVLRGSHITLNSDIDGELSPYALSVINAEVPQYTEDDFSYGIDAPKQKVSHHLLKWENTLKVDESEHYSFTYAGQIDDRKEFDIRRAGRSDLPALSIFQQTHFLEAKHQKKYENETEFKKGIQYTFTDNTNDADTGILPLIPDYLSHQLGTFVLVDRDIENWKFELGARYNFTYQNVVYIERNVERSLTRYNNFFHNYNVSGGVNYKSSKGYKWSLNMGYVSRNADVNELYSEGLHQGVAGYESGDPTLTKETGIKTILGLKKNYNMKWFFEGLVYNQYIDNYIYLLPSNTYTTTIRGTFPNFNYVQGDTRIVGLDLGTNYLFSDKLSVGAKYSFLRGDNLEENVPAVNMPANNALAKIDFKGDSNDGFFKDTSLGITYRYVWKQNHLLSWQDIKSPPNAYQLLNFDFEKQLKINHINVKLYGGVDNVFNVTYRDYLNRMRYFADDLGRSFTLGFRIKF